jgi:hypothetical protein
VQNAATIGVLTWNVMGAGGLGDRASRAKRVADALERLDPDVVCLQEASPPLLEQIVDRGRLTVGAAGEYAPEPVLCAVLHRRGVAAAPPPATLRLASSQLGRDYLAVWAAAVVADRTWGSSRRIFPGVGGPRRLGCAGCHGCGHEHVGRQRILALPVRSAGQF